MSLPAESRGVRAAGAAAAILCALLPWAALAVTLTRLMRATHATVPVAAELVSAGAAVAAVLGLALAGAATAVRARLRGGRVGEAGAALGVLGGAAFLLSAALSIAAPGLPWGVRMAEAAPVCAGGWALFVVAVAWRERRWPAWLRVAGAVWGATEMMLPAIPPLGPVALLVGLAWWLGVAVQLARPATGAESTSP